jgi:hypothetical protein
MPGMTGTSRWRLPGKIPELQNKANWDNSNDFNHYGLV